MPEPLESYFEKGTGRFWVRDAKDVWMPMNSGDYMLRLKQCGYRMHCKGGTSPAENEKIRIQNELNIDYAGTLAGYNKGLITQDGNRILVTVGPKMVEAAPVGWPTIEKFFDNLLGPVQKRYFMAWLHVAVTSLVNGSRRFGQAVCFAGPPSCGKSFMQNQIITPLLGGRSAKPYRYMMGKTSFNSDLFSAEHLVIEDEAASSDTRVRREFGSRLKEMTVNEVQSCHGKYLEAVSLHPFWRVTISTNDEPENLMVLPPFEDSMGHKIMLFRCNPSSVPMDTTDTDDYLAFSALIRKELQGLMWELMSWRSVPEDIADSRFGVRYHHDEELLEKFNQNNPENGLLELIDKVLFDGTGAPDWKGTARELEHRLTMGGFERQVGKLLSWHNATGTYLARLQKSHPTRVEAVRGTEGREWKLRPKQYPNGNGHVAI